jgi:hypothetical protein
MPSIADIESRAQFDLREAKKYNSLVQFNSGDEEE